MESAQLKPPSGLQLTGNLGENWQKFKQRFDLYSVASGLKEKSEDVQASALLHMVGEDALEVYNTFEFTTAADKMKVKPICEKFQEYCNLRKNATFERYKFSTHVQGSKGIELYITELKTLSQSCEFSTLCDSLTRDRIVCGITSSHLRERLLRETDLSLTKAIDICRATEVSKSQAQQLHVEQKQRKQSKKGKPKGKKVYYVNDDSESSGSDGDELFIGMVKADQNTDADEWSAKLKINGKNLKFKLDTGVDCNVISKTLFEKIRSNEVIKKCKTKLFAYNKEQIAIKGKVHKVVDIDFQALLGLNTCKELNLVKRIMVLNKEGQDASPNEMSQADKLMEEYDVVFHGLGNLGKDHIMVDKAVPPIVPPPPPPHAKFHLVYDPN